MHSNWYVDYQASSSASSLFSSETYFSFYIYALFLFHEENGTFLWDGVVSMYSVLLSILILHYNKGIHPLLTVPKCWYGHGANSAFTCCIQMQVSKPEFCIMTYSLSFASSCPFSWISVIAKNNIQAVLGLHLFIQQPLKLQQCWENAYMIFPWSSGRCSNPTATGSQSGCLSARPLIMTS